MADLLRRHRDTVTRLNAAAVQERRRTEQLAKAVALAVWRKSADLDSPETRLLWQALAGQGVAVESLAGRPVAEVEADADIVDWVDPAEGLAPGTVAEAFEPQVTLDGKVIHIAKLTAVRTPDAEAPHAENQAAASGANSGSPATCQDEPIEDQPGDQQ
jgi:predicted phage tail protein